MAFNYSALRGPEWIRLIRLGPEQGHSDRLTCSIEQISLEFATEIEYEYEALSYVWGGAEPKYLIECNGKALRITANLGQALLHLRRTEHRTLWVDAICINQSDIEERSAQVRLMSRIYEAAKSVVVWLGEESSTHQKLSLTSHGLGREGIGEEATYGNLLRYLTHPWFNRVWILQEALLAKQLIMLLDHEGVQWDRFWARISVELLHTDGGAKDPPIVARPALRLYALTSTSRLIRSLRCGAIASWAFADLGLSIPAEAEFSRILDFSSTLKVSDPRDRVYALLGLLEPMGIHVPAPDYSKSIDIVFQEVFAAVEKGRLSYQAIHPSVVHTQRKTGDDRVPGLLRQPLGSEIMHGRASYSLDGDRLTSPHCWDGSAFAWPPRGGQIHRQYTGNSQWSLPIHLFPRSYRSTAVDAYTSDKLLAGVIRDNMGAKFERLGNDVKDFDEGLHPEAIFLSENNDEARGIYHSFFDDILIYHKRVLLVTVLDHLGYPSSGGSFINCIDSTHASGTNTALCTAYSELSHATQVHKENSCGRTQKPQGFRRKRDDEDDEDDDEDDERHFKKRSSIDPRDRLACPYFQRNSQGPRINQACRGPGWDKISRLKEHLYRTHRVYPCDRCKYVFNDRQSLRRHHQSPQACNAENLAIPVDPAEGFDEQQNDDLRPRTVRSWCQIFKILFPLDLEDSYPPEHYSNTQAVEFFDNFQVHHQRESERLTPQYVTDSLRSTLAQQTLEQLRSVVLNIVNTLNNEILRSYRMAIHQESTDFEAPAQRREGDVASSVIGMNPFIEFDDYLQHVAPDGVPSNTHADLNLSRSDWASFILDAEPQISFEAQTPVTVPMMRYPAGDGRIQTRVGSSQVLVGHFNGPSNAGADDTDVGGGNDSVEETWDVV
ncbi:heterokaryon incompatibility protein-domain-containing protein [Xylariales sp. AK1849]|nr:heterokaryon incompatibility protein-domain-containing protein [Xylariales sp. AK1849]